MRLQLDLWMDASWTGHGRICAHRSVRRAASRLGSGAVERCRRFFLLKKQHKKTTYYKNKKYTVAKLIVLRGTAQSIAERGCSRSRGPEADADQLLDSVDMASTRVRATVKTAAAGTVQRARPVRLLQRALLS